MLEARTVVDPLKVLTLMLLAGLWAQLPAVARAEGPADEALARGGVELSTAVALSVTKASDDEDALTTLNVPVRLGVMVARGLEVEAEALVSHLSFGDGDDNTGVIGALHLLYHFRTRGSTVPYLLAGGGYGTGIEFVGLASDENDAGLLRAGVGFKTFFSRRASLRGEYRFTHYFVKGDEFQDDRSANDHKILVGISLWF
jgi:opacity protein-like surface antigen